METFTNSAEFGVISQRDFFDHAISKIDSLDGYYIVRNEDFVYNCKQSSKVHTFSPANAHFFTAGF